MENQPGRTAYLKAAEANAHEIAGQVARQLNPANRVRVYYDRTGQTWGVQVVVGRDRYDLLMPAAGALYPLWRNGAWLGGMNLNTDAAPAAVATRLLGQVAAQHRHR